MQTSEDTKVVDVRTDRFVPAIGRIVHYHDSRGCRPAIITTVWNDECVNLTVFSDGTFDPGESNTHRVTSVVRGHPGVLGYWHLHEDH